VPERDPTCIGRVRHVLGSQITVALDTDLAGVAPIYSGRLVPVGQIGSLVRFPQGLVELFGTVTLLGISELAGAQLPADVVQTGERWLQVQLLGEVDRGTKTFTRGVGSYPGLDDPAHFATPDDLGPIYPSPGDENLRLGRLASAEDVAVCVEARPLVLRHSAIVGSTGAGKTSAVASLLQSFIASGWTGANIVVIDPHGEYARALGGSASVRSVLGENDTRLRVPYWALPASQILRIVAGPSLSGAGAKRFGELVAEQRTAFAEDADWLSLDMSAITSDTPIPFDINKVWYELDYANRETRADKANPDTTCEEEPGDPAMLKPARFTPYAPAGGSPFQGPQFGAYATLPERLRLGLVDPRMRFFLELTGSTEGPDPLVPAMHHWLGNSKPVSVLDFNGVPAEAAEAAIGVVLSLLFEVAVRSPDDGPGIGRPNPVLVILEEAHRYLGDESAELARNSANRIAREGRKYGIGLMLVTQRPSELPDTALAQCGSLISLRLSSQTDQAKIRSALPDSVAGLAAVLPSLRTGEAIISGEAVVLPSRVLIRRPDPLPKAEDPSLAPWRVPKQPAELDQALAAWREAYAQ
jgi:uncharacterized protein